MRVLSACLTLGFLLSAGLHQTQSQQLRRSALIWRQHILSTPISFVESWCNRKNLGPAARCDIWIEHRDNGKWLSSCDVEAFAQLRSPPRYWRFGLRCPYPMNTKREWVIRS